MIRSTAAALALVLVLASCGDDAPSALSADDLATKANSICRKATKGFDALDGSEASDFLTDSVDLFDTASEALAALPAAKSEQSDYDDFTSSISKQVKQAKKALTAADDGDTAALQAAVQKIATLAEDSDSLADDLDLTRCVGLGLAAVAPGGAGPIDPTATTIDPSATTVPLDTTPATAPVTTVPGITLPPTIPPAVTLAPATLPPQTIPLDTSSVDTAPVDTTSFGDSPATNAIDNWTAPPGFEFDRDTGDLLGTIFGDPSLDPVLGPTLVAYEVGAMSSADTGSVAILRVVELADGYAEDQISALITFQGTDDGAIHDTAGGNTVWAQVFTDSDSDFTITLAALGRYGVTIQSSNDVDADALFDAFVLANFE